jgi:hypothetical protein
MACFEDADRDGHQLVVGEVTRSKFDGKLSKALQRRNANWCALEIVPGVLLVVAAIPDGESIPPALDAITLDDLAQRLVTWAREVRTGPDAYGKKNKKARPARTSKGWQLNRPEPKGEWRQVAKIDTRDVDEVAKVIRSQGARITCETADAGERRGGGDSLVWLVEYRCDEETAGRVREALARIGEGPPVRIVRRDEKDEPGWTPFEGKS